MTTTYCHSYAETQYFGPTDTKGARIVVYVTILNRKTIRKSVPYDHSIPASERQIEALKSVLLELKHNPPFITFTDTKRGIIAIF